MLFLICEGRKVPKCYVYFSGKIDAPIVHEDIIMDVKEEPIKTQDEMTANKHDFETPVNKRQGSHEAEVQDGLTKQHIELLTKSEKDKLTAQMRKCLLYEKLEHAKKGSSGCPGTYVANNLKPHLLSHFKSIGIWDSWVSETANEAKYDVSCSL